MEAMYSVINSILLLLLLFDCGLGDIEIDGGICGFIDVNFDQYTDLIMQSDVDALQVQVQSKEDRGFALDTKFDVKLTDCTSIESCAVADFNGDSYPDILVTYKSVAKSNEFVSKILLGSDNKFDTSIASFTQLSDHPIVVDYNFDGISDFVVSKGKSRVCMPGIDISGNFTLLEGENCPFAMNKTEKLTQTSNFAHGYVDLDGDFRPNIIFGVVNDATNKLIMQKWTQESDNIWQSKILTPIVSENALFHLSQTYGSPSFADFDADGQMEMIIPYCQDECQKLSLLVYCDSQSKWIDLGINLTENGVKWKQILDGTGSFHLRVGDFNSDGFPDLITILQPTAKSEENRSIMLLHNVECVGIACKWGRTFSMGSQFQILRPAGHSVLQMVTFFDLQEDGELDILVEFTNDSKNKIQFIGAADKGDTTFLKAEVCTSTCKYCGADQQRQGSKISGPGMTLRFEMTDTSGTTFKGCHTQLSQSSHRALQLPYALFGLGRSPNFVESLSVGVPAKRTNTLNKNTWPQIVPNSRVYVIPFPADNPKMWIERLYITPSRLILLSAAALCCICGTVLFIILGLQWQESRVDKIEREQETRMHFDLM